jgi:hypothetical protein
MTFTYFGVIPDGSQKPAGLFQDLEDAIDWALRRYGSDAFRICHHDALPAPAEDAKTAS